MSELVAYVLTVDGGRQDIPITPADVIELRRLECEGYSGKALIHAWLTDDWGPSPVYIQISGKDSEGRPVDLKISYD